MRKRTLARECALKILYQIDLTQEPAESCIDNFWKFNEEIEPEVKDFSVMLVKKTIENLEQIDKNISKLAENWDLSRMAIIDKNILRLSSCELLYLEEVPPKVSINEAVELAKKYSGVDSSKFVNGILDKVKSSRS